MPRGKKDRLWIAAVMILQLCICICAGRYKKSFFCDEIYSYGLANSASYAFIDPQSAERYSETGWVDEAYFKQYIEVGSKDGFSMRAAFENQEQDVHPPFYYCLLYAVCFVFRGSFSKWTGLGLNFLILIVTDLLLLDLTSWILRDIKKQLLVMMLWSCSAAGISNILFIRMYLLLTCEMLAFAAFHARVLRRTGQWTFRARDYGLLLLLVAMGGLTHYYFYPFVFFFSGCVCIYLFVCRQIAAMVRYAFSLLGGFALALAVFPATISHVRNSYRVTEVIDNLSGREEDVYAVYLRWVDQSAFGGSFKILSVVFVVCIVWKCVSRYFFSFQVRFDPPSQSFMLEVKKEERKHAGVWQVVLQPLHVFTGILFLSYVGFGVVAVKGSQIMQNRYIYPLYPVIVLLFVCAAVFCIRQTAAHKHERKILLAVTVWMCLWSIRTYGIDFLYADYEIYQEQAEQVRDSDCLLLYGDTWLDTYTALPLKRIYDETYFLHPSEITEVARILQLRKTKDPVVVCLPDACTQEDAEAILVQIEDAGGFQGHQMVYQYYTQAYRMM